MTTRDDMFRAAKSFFEDPSITVTGTIEGLIDLEGELNRLIDHLTTIEEGMIP